MGTAYAQVLAATGGVGPYTWALSAGALPTGLALNASTGAISGTPTATGSFGFTVQVTDSAAQTATGQLSIAVNSAAPSNPPPPLVITTTSLPSGTAGQAYSATLTASGGVTPYTWSITAGKLPAGLSLTSATGVISGTPTASGFFAITVQVADSNGQASSAQLGINIAAPPSTLLFTTSSLPSGTTGTAYSAKLSASGGTSPYSWSMTTGALPAGLSLNGSTGEISGTPTATGTFSFTAQVTDATGQTATAALSITIVSPASPLTIVNSTLPSGIVGRSYQTGLSASGGAPPYTWAISGGALPPGLSLATSSGVISGTPTKAGTFNFTAQVTDSAGHTQSAALSITINPPPALTITTTSLPNGTAGTAYSGTLSASGGVTPYTWAITAGALPSGLSLSPASGSITGTPTTAGTFNFTAQVTDSVGQTQSAALSITINAPPPLTITTTSLPNGTTGTAYSATLSANGGVTPYTWSIIAGALPPGLALSAGSGVISGTPTQAGTFAFTAQVADSAGQTKSAALSITVNAPALTITTSSLPSGVTGTSYSATLSASGGVPPYTWAITAGALPAGLTLNVSTGAIGGTPTTAGTFNFTAQVTDSAAHTQSAALSITINAPPPLSITTTTLPGATQGTAYSATLTATGGTTPYKWTITAGALPAGLSLAASTGTISGTPTTLGTFDFTAQVTDSSGHTQSAALSITVTASDTIQNVVIVVEENKSFGEVIGNTGAMPYLNSLADTYAYGVNYYANILSSQGDYFMLTVGELLTTNSSFTGVTTDDNVVRHLINAGISWKAYAESLPYAGYLGGNQYPYIKIHNPFVYLSDVVNSQTEADNVVPFSQMATDLSNGSLPAYSFVIPNAQSDGHDCPPGMSTCSLDDELSYTDSWLKNNIEPLLADANFKQHGLLIITWDESDGDSTNGGGPVAWVVVGAKVKTGYRGTGFYQHQSTLKLMMQALGLTSFPNAAANAPNMNEFFSSDLP